MINPIDDRVYVWYPGRIGVHDVADLKAKASGVDVVLGYERHPVILRNPQRSIVDTDVGLIARLSGDRFMPDDILACDAPAARSSKHITYL